MHLAEVGTTAASGFSHWRFGNVDWRVVLKIGIPGAVGAFAGATVLSNLSTESATPWVAGCCCSSASTSSPGSSSASPRSW